MVLTLLALLSTEPAAGGWTLSPYALLHGGFTALPSDPLDFSSHHWAATLGGSATSGELTLLATARVSRDSAETVEPGRSLLAAAWPGTPWLGASLSHSHEGVFVPGLREPLVEHGTFGPDSSDVLSLSLGGLLGTDARLSGHLTGAGDTLTILTVEGPWLGFGSFTYRDMEILGPGSGSLEVLEAFADLRAVEPWVLLARTGGGADSSAAMIEFSGLDLLDREWGRLEIVPSAAWAGDSVDLAPFRAGRAVAGLDLLLRPSTLALSAGLGLEADPSDPGGASGTAGFHMVSESGVCYDLAASGIGGRGWQLRGGPTLRTGRASTGAEVIVTADSTRVGGTAGYTPAPGVRAVFGLEADAVGTLDPVGFLRTVFHSGRTAASLTLERSNGETTLEVSICASFY
jgi:hypothetical protein